MAPKASYRIDSFWVPVVALVLFEVAALALWSAGARRVAVLFAIVAVVNQTIAFSWNRGWAGMGRSRTTVFCQLVPSHRHFERSREISHGRCDKPCSPYSQVRRCGNDGAEHTAKRFLDFARNDGEVRRSCQATDGLHNVNRRSGRGRACASIRRSRRYRRQAGRRPRVYLQPRPSARA